MPKGRPAISGERKRDVLRIRLDGAERALLDSAAAASGKPTSTWARDTLLQLAAFTVAQQSRPAKKTAAKKTAGRDGNKPNA